MNELLHFPPEQTWTNLFIYHQKCINKLLHFPSETHEQTSFPTRYTWTNLFIYFPLQKHEQTSPIPTTNTLTDSSISQKKQMNKRLNFPPVSNTWTKCIHFPTEHKLFHSHLKHMANFFICHLMKHMDKLLQFPPETHEQTYTFYPKIHEQSYSFAT